MITLRKITYSVGLGISISMFGLFLYSFLPQLIENNPWVEIGNSFMSDEELLKKLKAHPSYAAFYERFPDAKEELRNHRHGGSLQVGVSNFDKDNMLSLNLVFQRYDGQVNANVYCETMGDERNRNLNAHGLFVLDFIENTNCLELEPTVNPTEYGNLAPRPTEPVVVFYD